MLLFPSSPFPPSSFYPVIISRSPLEIPSYRMGWPVVDIPSDCHQESQTAYLLVLEPPAVPGRLASRSSSPGGGRRSNNNTFWREHAYCQCPLEQQHWISTSSSQQVGKKISETGTQELSHAKQTMKSGSESTEHRLENVSLKNFHVIIF